MARLAIKSTIVAVFLLGASVNGNHANAERTSAVSVRSAKKALLHRKRGQRSRGVPQTVKVYRLKATQNRRGRISVVGRKKGENVLHPTMGLLKVNRQSAAKTDKAEIRITETTKTADGKPNELVIISDAAEYAGETTIATNLMTAIASLAVPRLKKAANPDSVFAASISFAKKHGLVADRVGETDIFFYDTTTVKASYEEKPVISILLRERSLLIEHYEGERRIGTTHSSTTKLVNELRAALRREFPIKVDRWKLPFFPS